MTRSYFSTPTKLLILAALSAFAAFELAPLLWLISTALKHRSDVFGTAVIPHDPTLRNFSYVWNQADVQRYFVNSLIVSTSTVVLNVSTAALLGYALARLRFRGRQALFVLGLSTMVIPFQSIMLPLFITARDLHLTNNLLGIIIPTAAFNLWLSVYILREAFAHLPVELEEAALIDGCSHWRIYRSVLLPLVKAPLATAAILVFTLTWSDFLWPLLIMRDPRHFTLSVGLQYFMSTLTSNWHHIAAISVIAAAPTLVLFLALQRYFFSGVLTGATKG
jgi:ABC-type glycerol-3-phosphate transport system permease component